jgi:hypothetical protein
MNVSLLSSLIGLFSGNQNGPGLPLSNRNLFVDGNFDSIIATSATLAANASTNGVATMYYAYSGAGGAATVSNTAAPFAVGAEPNGMSSPVSNVLTLNQTTASTGSVTAGTSPSISQKVENVSTLQGRYATFSCWLWCANGTQTITNVSAVQNFGLGGSPSASVQTNIAVNWTLTTTPQRFSCLVPVPTTLGKTMGTTANTSFLQVFVNFPVGATYAINTTQWQLEQSSPQAGSLGAPTAFEYRGAQPELNRIQRYYKVLNFGAGANFNGLSTGSADAYSFNVMDTPMRATPTGLIVGAGVSFVTSSGTANTGGSITCISPQNWYLHLAQTGGPSYAAGYFNCTIANQFTFDARL